MKLFLTAGIDSIRLDLQRECLVRLIDRVLGDPHRDHNRPGLVGFQERPLLAQGAEECLVGKHDSGTRRPLVDADGKVAGTITDIGEQKLDVDNLTWTSVEPRRRGQHQPRRTRAGHGGGLAQRARWRELSLCRHLDDRRLRLEVAEVVVVDIDWWGLNSGQHIFRFRVHRDLNDLHVAGLRLRRHPKRMVGNGKK